MSLSKFLLAGAAATCAACYTAYHIFFKGPDKQDDRPSSIPPSRDSAQPRAPQREERQLQQTIDSSQRDHAPAEVSGQSLRAMANQAGDLMEQCFRLSKEAYKRDDHAHAKQLSEDGERHKHKMERLHALASAAIFKENNRGKGACDIDLHGLRVKEAIDYAEKAVKEARWRAEPEVRLIVGQGNHSDGGVARLKPAVQDAMQSHGYRVDVDPRNVGVLIVRLGERR